MTGIAFVTVVRAIGDEENRTVIKFAGSGKAIAHAGEKCEGFKRTGPGRPGPVLSIRGWFWRAPYPLWSPDLSDFLGGLGGRDGGFGGSFRGSTLGFGSGRGSTFG